MKKSFTTRVFLLHFIILAIPLLIDAIILFSRFYSDSIDEARNHLVETAHYRGAALQEMSPVPDNFLKDLVFFLDLSNGITPKAIEEIQNLNQINGLEENVFGILGIEEGKQNLPILASTLKAYRHKTWLRTPFLQQVIHNGQGAEMRYVGRGEDANVLIFNQGRLIEKNEVPIAVLIAGVEVKKSLDELFTDQSNLDIQFAISDVEGIIYYSSLPSFPGNYFYPLTPKQKQLYNDAGQIGLSKFADKPLKMSTSEKGFVDFEFEGTHYLAYLTPIPHLDMSLLTFASKKQYLHNSLKHLIVFSIIFLIVILIGVILAYFLALWVSRPLRQLNHVMGEVSGGALTKRFNPQPFGYEINIIGTLYNETLEAMLTNMKNAENELVKRETYEKEVELSRNVQESLLSLALPELEGVNAAAFYLQAREVGGDFFCLEEKKDGRFWLAVGDASGKGISSCLFALTARSMMRTYAAIYDEVEVICAKTNDDFLENAGDTGMFVTSLLGLYSPQTKILSYYSCGHVPGLVRRADGTLVELSHSGMALGLLEARGYQSDQIQLGLGDLVLFYTKGLSEGVNKHNQYFSLKKIKELLQHRKWERAQEVVDGLMDEYREFISGVEQEDEVVIVVFEIT